MPSCLLPRCIIKATKGRFDLVHLICDVLAGLQKYRDSMVIKLVDRVLEELHRSLELIRDKDPQVGDVAPIRLSYSLDTCSCSWPCGRREDTECHVRLLDPGAPFPSPRLPLIPSRVGNACTYRLFYLLLLQAHLALAKLLGEMYNYSLVPSVVIFEALYHFINHGHEVPESFKLPHPNPERGAPPLPPLVAPYVTHDPRVPSAWDPPADTFRTQLVCKLLQVGGGDAGGQSKQGGSCRTSCTGGSSSEEEQTTIQR